MTQADLDRFESMLRMQGFSRIAGVDEAGRGALAGPLVAAAVILPPAFDRTGLADSKQLTPAQRETHHERILASCTVTIRTIAPAVIDARGLHRCNLAILRRCVRGLQPAPDYALTDGFPVREMPCPSLGVKKGDAVAASIAAASIVAKVTRDAIMTKLDRHYPGYGFADHKGYGTPEHLQAIEDLGPTEVHRWSFAGVGQPSLPGLGRMVRAVRESMGTS